MVAHIPFSVFPFNAAANRLAVLTETVSYSTTNSILDNMYTQATILGAGSGLPSQF